MSIESVKYIRNENNDVTGYEVVTEGFTWSVPINTENRHYQEIQEWVAEGNTPEEAD